MNQKCAITRTEVRTISRDQIDTNTPENVPNFHINLKESGIVPVCNSFDFKQEHGAKADPEAQLMKILGK